MNMTDIPYTFPIGWCLPAACEDKDDKFLNSVNKRVSSGMKLAMKVMNGLWDWNDLYNNKFFTPKIEKGTTE